MKYWRTSLMLVWIYLSGPWASAAPGVGIGVLGDSYSDEYQFYSPDRATSRNWVEFLASTRGLNFGEFRPEGRDEPRNQGYSYNWARSAATSADMIASGQHTGLAAQVARGEVRMVVIFIGGNDFLQAIESPRGLEAFDGLAGQVAANLRLAVETLEAASPEVKILVATVPDLTDLPEIREKIRAGNLGLSLVSRAAAELENFNAQVRRMAIRSPRVALFDFSRLCRASSLVYPKQLSVGGRRVDRGRWGNDLDCLFLADQRHLGTIGQAWLAKAIVATLNAKFSAGITPVEDKEILTFCERLRGGETSKTVANAQP